MEPTASQLLTEILRAQDSVTELRGETLTSQAVAEAVSEGIRIAVSDPAVWSAAIEAMQTRARSEAGGWLLGGIKSAASKLIWLMVIGTGVYLIGGWTALVSLFKAGSQ